MNQIQNFKILLFKKALIRLRGVYHQHLVKKELQQLKFEKETLIQRKKLAWTDFFKKKSLYRPLFIAVFIKIAQHFSGINAVIIQNLRNYLFKQIILIEFIQKVAFYSTKIFENVGLKGSWPTYITILLSAVQVIMTSICMFIIEKVGRRVLLIYGTFGMCLSAFTVALSRINASPEKEWLYYVTVVAAISYLVCYSISLGNLI